MWVLCGWYESEKKLFKFYFHVLLQNYIIGAMVRSVLINVDTWFDLLHKGYNFNIL